MVVGPPALGDLAGVGELAPPRVLDAHGEGRHALAASLGHEGHHQARVHAAGEERPHRHVRHEVRDDGVAQALAGLFHQVALGGAALRQVGELPVAAQLDARRRADRAAPLGAGRVRPGDVRGVEDEDVGRRQLGDAFEHRPRAGDEAQRQVLVERLEVGLRRLGERGQDRLDLRGEEEAAAVGAEEERLLAEAVAGEEEPAPAAVPDGEGEHAAQLVDDVLAALLVEVEDDLGVARRLEAVAAPLEVAAQLAMVVDLAVENDPRRAVLVPHRLVAAREIDDRQAPHGEADLAHDHLALVVGTAVGDRRVHPAERLALDPVGVPFTADAAHAILSLSKLPGAERGLLCGGGPRGESRGGLRRRLRRAADHLGDLVLADVARVREDDDLPDQTQRQRLHAQDHEEDAQEQHRRENPDKRRQPRGGN